MQILIAADSFKDALDADLVCAAIAKGLERAGHKTSSLPLADGGEGTAKILTNALGGNWQEIEAQDPLDRSIKAGYGLSKDQSKAFIEMATASGIMLLKEKERSPFLTSSYGTGQLIAAARAAGAKEVFLCLGGSATNDGGIGMAAALGWQFLDQSGQSLQNFNAATIPHIATIIPPNSDLGLKVTVLCDVQNPLLGPEGASHIYGPQKGAKPEDIAVLDHSLAHLAKLVYSFNPSTLANIPGAGAAGGLGFGAMAFMNAQLKAGAETVLEILGFSDLVQKADLVITGEGKLDGQTLHGKLIHTLCKKAEQVNKPVIALCGSLQADTQSLRTIGLKAAFSISKGPQSLSQALENTALYLERTATEVGQLL